MNPFFIYLQYTLNMSGAPPPPTTDISDADIRAISEVLYALDSNKATASELTIDPQALVPNSQTSSKNDLSPRR